MLKLLIRSVACLLVPFVFLAGCGSASHLSSTTNLDQNLSTYSNASLNGTYILTATGANFLGNEAIAAQFTANGQGQLTTGTLLTNTFGNGTQVVDTTFTGNYSVQSDGRGTATFNPATGDGLKIQFVITATGINLIRFDNLGVATGAIMKQDASVSSVNGRFVYNLDGWLTVDGQTFEQHSVGSLTFNNAEASTTREIVRIGANTPIATSEDLIGSFTLSGNGIGTATLTGPASTLRLRLFFVSADRAIVMTDTEGKLFAGIAERQSSAGNTGSNAVLNGNYTFLTRGTDYGSFSERWVGIGSMTADGNGTINGVRDTSGLVTNEVKAPFTATYSMIADGHGTMTIPGGPQLAIYTVSPDKALIVGSGENTYAWGVLQKQSAGTFNTGSVTGKFGIVMGGGPICVSGLWNASGSGSLTGTVDFYNNGTLAEAQSITGTYQVDSTGRGTGTVVASAVGLGMKTTFYVVSQNEVWIMATEPSLVLGGANKQ